MKSTKLNTVTAFLMLMGFVAGCSQPSDGRLTGTTPEFNKLLFTIAWCGPETKPIQERGFASEQAAEQLKAWVAEFPFARRGEVLSDKECALLVQFIDGKTFKTHRTAKQPDAAYTPSQYMAIVRLGDKTSYYLLGTGKSSKAELVKLKATMELAHGQLLNDIIDSIPTD